MAAKGYWDAFQEVRKSVARVLDGEDAAAIVEAEHLNWYRAMFQPSLAAGIVQTQNLAGHRPQFVGPRGRAPSPAQCAAVAYRVGDFLDGRRHAGGPQVRALTANCIV